MTGPTRREAAATETWQVIGAALFGLGLLAILVALVPVVLGTGTLPVELRLAPLLAPLGVVVGVVGPAWVRRAARRSPEPASRPASGLAPGLATPSSIDVTPGTSSAAQV